MGSNGMDKTASTWSKETAIERHSTFYFKDDPMVIFLVENQLFKVHRYHLIQESEVFCDMFSVPTEGAEVEGMSDDRPIHLPDVTVKGFELLLNYLYNFGRPYTDNDNASIRADQEGKLSLLGIAHRFAFDDIFQLMVKELVPDRVPLITRIHLGEKYGLEEWLFSAYETLLDRPESLNLDEAAALGPDRVICFIKARDYIHRECMEIAQADLQQEKNRVERLEQLEQRRNLKSWGFDLATGDNSVTSTRVPTTTAAVTRMFFR